MKIALIGPTGLLGSAIKQELLKRKIKSLFLSHNNFDVCNVNNYYKILEFEPDIVINTAAYLGVDPCEEAPLEAFKLNTKAVEDLAKFCKTHSICLAHISSDAVFDGKVGNYDEDSIPNPINMYGLTKYGGELMAKNLSNKYYIFRIPILFGIRENKGNIFIEKMYNLYQNGTKHLKIADDVINRPSYNCDIAKKIIEIISEKYEFGIYHVFNGGNYASLYDFAVAFFQKMGIKDVIINRAKAKDFSKNELGEKPLNTTIISKKINSLRNWELAMSDFCEKFKERICNER